MVPWRGLDSNQRRREPADLQSAPFGHLGTPPHALLRLSSRVWLAKSSFHSSRGRRGDSNPGPTDYKSVALPPELHRQTPYLQQVGLDDDAGTGFTNYDSLTAKHPNYSTPGTRAVQRGSRVLPRGGAGRQLLGRAAQKAAPGRGQRKPPDVTERCCARPSASPAGGTPHRGARPLPPRR
jgi:hypothetical protein